MDRKFERSLRALLLSRFIGQRLRALTPVERQGDLVFLKDVIEAGKVTPVIGRTYPLDEAAKALSDADEGHARGKAVITVCHGTARSRVRNTIPSRTLLPLTDGWGVPSDSVQTSAPDEVG